MLRAPCPSERTRMTIRNPRHMDGFWIPMGLLADFIRQRMGRGWADCCGGYPTKPMEKSQKDRGVPMGQWSQRWWISYGSPDFLQLTLIRFAWGGPREVPFVSWQLKVLPTEVGLLSVCQLILRLDTLSTSTFYIHILYSIINRRAIYSWYFFCGRFWNYFWVPGSMLSCFSANLFFAFPASLLNCFSACLLLCFTCFFSFLLLCFPCFSALLLLCFTCFFFFLLLCFPCFFAFLLLCICAFLLLFYFFFSSGMCFCCSTSCPSASLFPVFTASLLFFSFALPSLVCKHPRWNPKKP